MVKRTGDEGITGTGADAGSGIGRPLGARDLVGRVVLGMENYFAKVMPTETRRAT